MVWSRGIICSCNLLAVLIVGCVFFGCDTEGNLEPQVAFIKYYGGEGNQEAVDLHVNNDGTIILLGTTTNNGTSNIFLVKTDYNGNTLKTATFGNDADVARDLEPTDDGNFIVLSRFRSQGIDSVKLLKITPDLIKLDSVVDGFPGKDAYPNTVTAIDQAGVKSFIVTGSTTFVEVPNNAVRSAMHLRFSDNLEKYIGIWQRSHSTSLQNPGVTDIGVRTVALDATRFYVFGYSNSWTQSQMYQQWYYSLNDMGNPGNNNFVSSTSQDLVSDASSSSTLAFGSISTSETSGAKALTFSRYPIYTRVVNVQEEVKELGNPITIKLSAGNSLRNLEAVKIVSKNSGDGYFVVANEIELDNSRNIWVSRIDEAGNVIWSATFGAKTNDDRAGSVDELPNGRVVVLGTMNLENQDKLALINLSSSGKLKN